MLVSLDLSVGGGGVLESDREMGMRVKVEQVLSSSGLAWIGCVGPIGTHEFGVVWIARC